MARLGILDPQCAVCGADIKGGHLTICLGCGEAVHKVCRDEGEPCIVEGCQEERMIEVPKGLAKILALAVVTQPVVDRSTSRESPPMVSRPAASLQATVGHPASRKGNPGGEKGSFAALMGTLSALTGGAMAHGEPVDDFSRLTGELLAIETRRAAIEKRIQTQGFQIVAYAGCLLFVMGMGDLYFWMRRVRYPIPGSLTLGQVVGIEAVLLMVVSCLTMLWLYPRYTACKRELDDLTQLQECVVESLDTIPKPGSTGVDPPTEERHPPAVEAQECPIRLTSGED